jgi:UDP-N-acetylmuramyl pentapeptide synthase
MNFFNRLQIIFKKPKVVIVSGLAKKEAQEAIFAVLKIHFKMGQEVILYLNQGDYQEMRFLMKHSKLAVLVVTHMGEIPLERELFSGLEQDVLEVGKLIESPFPYLVLNSDDETVMNLRDKNQAKSLTFGLAARADLRATDLVVSEDSTNFKINYEGNSVPIWLPSSFGKEAIYSALVAAGVGEALGLNLIEISQALKNYQPLTKEEKRDNVENSV